MDRNDRLARAKKYLAIAEARDSKREAYKAAAKEVAAYRTETRATYADIAISLGKSKDYPKRLVDWCDSGFKAETPFLMDSQATTRASVSHTKKVLREHSAAEIKEILDDLPDAVVKKVSEATEETKITRTLYPDRPKPTHKQATERAKARDAALLKKNPMEATARLGAVVGSARAAVRAVVRQYEEFLALVDDDEFLEEGRDRIVGLRTDVDLALGEVLEGSIDEALTRLLAEEAR